MEEHGGYSESSLKGFGRQSFVALNEQLLHHETTWNQNNSRRCPICARWQVILQATTTARRTQHKSFLESVPTLEQLTEYEILTIADALVEDSYEDGDVICTQGEVGDAFYIIKKVSYHSIHSKIVIFCCATESSILLSKVGNSRLGTSKHPCLGAIFGDHGRTCAKRLWIEPHRKNYRTAEACDRFVQNMAVCHIKPSNSCSGGHRLRERLERVGKKAQESACWHSHLEEEQCTRVQKEY